jgi:WD40 repeat protein
VKFAERASSVFAADFSPDGALIVTASGEANIYDARTGKRVGSFAAGQHIVSVAYAPKDPVIATGSKDGTIRIWDAKTYQPKGKDWKVPDAAWIRSVAFSPDGKRLLTASGDHARIWDVARREQVGALMTALPMNEAVYSPDGRRIATSSGGRIRIWPAFPTTRDLMDRARELWPRGLDPTQRAQFSLETADTASAQ